MTKLQELIIPIKTDKSGATTDIINLKGDLLSLAKSALPIFGVGEALSFAKNQATDAIKDTVAYAKEVRTLSLVSDTTTEASSRLIQVLDDYGVTADSILRATKKLTDSGYAPTIETIAKLSDKYLSLHNVVQQNDFMIQTFGKNYQEFVSVMNQGSEAILAKNAAVQKGLILTEEDIVKTRAAEIAMDNWNDSVAAAKTEWAVGTIPTLTKVLSIFTTLSEKQHEQVKGWEFIIPAVGSVHSLYVALTNSGKAAASSSDIYTEALKEQKKQINDTNSALQGLNSTTNSYWQNMNAKNNQGTVRYTYYGTSSRGSGGSVIAGQSYNVSEFYKPEVFVPNQSGRIEPASNLQKEQPQAVLDEERLFRLLVSAVQQGALS